MRTRRLSALTAGVVALSLVAAACGDDDDDGASDTEAPAETEAAADDEEMADEEEMSEDEMAEEDGEMSEMAECESIDSVSLQLQWFIQAQFAGYFAAQDEGFYEDFCLEVEIVEGGVEIVPQPQLANGRLVTIRQGGDERMNAGQAGGFLDGGKINVGTCQTQIFLNGAVEEI
jgi:NitT/TauT family transport system substrate-binding protein